MNILGAITQRVGEVRVLDAKTETCNNPEHGHRGNGEITMTSIEVRGHVFDITKDGDTYNVRHAGSSASAIFEVSKSRVIEYITDRVPRD